MTIYENGRRYYSTPLLKPIPANENTVINGEEISVNDVVEPDGTRFTTLMQKINSEEFEQYKADPLKFTKSQLW